ncbi:phage tail tape measure protein [Proteus mirabilis]|uniref:Phage tail tape measure protein n=5 Tax=Proteus mirabilis TaxID=584 RepID=A0A7D5W5Y8_PROMI|nr:phage tail tape measure protein [Proteus mirabilis]MBA7799773.1 phage tail tape measure protein [Citrobacter sp. RHBSTW-01065]ATC78660.1 phage tail tape measure protein [Proteus mirabilis]EJD6332803.1 phage tail tape measure protein [Proteus mirabilis]EJD6351205.1 phage tail tape measure protein [Proteus mirabilis]EJD6359895.1 phage tail tape measure protein [Proteus mirabilis]
MSQQIADLTINLGAETADFKEQMGRVERQLQETAEKAEASQRRMAQLVEQQAQTARSSAESTAQSLQELNNQQEISQQQRADYYQRIAQEEARSAIESRKQADAFLEQAQSVGQTRDALEQLTEVLNKSTKAYNKLKITGEQFAEIQNVTKSRIKAIQDQQDANTEKYFKQIEAVKGLSGGTSALRTIQAQLNQEVKKGTIHQQDYRTLISAITSESMKLRREEESLTQQKTRFIQRLKEQVATQNLSREQMLRYQASQLGVSSSAEIYIRRLSELSKETKEFDKNSKSLAGRLQGIANSFNMGSLVRGGIWGGITAGLTGVAKLAYDAEREFSQFNKQLILTGNYADKSASQLNEMARTLAGGGITRGEMALSISSVVGTGVFSNNEISRVSKAAAQMNYITGQAIDTTIDQFKRLQDEPLQMSLELEKANHHLTASQLEQIRILELQGNKTEAAKLAIDAYAQSINDGANDISDSLGFLESAWINIQREAKKAWDAMLDIGRDKGVTEKLTTYKEQLYQLQLHGMENSYEGRELQKVIKELENKKYEQDLKNAQAQAVKDSEQFKVNQIRNQEKWKSYFSWETQRLQKLAELEQDKHSLTQKQYEEAKAMINFRLRDRQMPGTGKGKGYVVPTGNREEEKASRDLLALQAQLEMLKKHQSANDVISQQRKDFQKEQAQFAILEQAQLTRRLTNAEKSLLSNKENILAQKEKLALVGDEVALQERLNKMQDQADKYIVQQSEKRKAIEESMGKSAREQQRYLERAQLLAGQKENPQLNNMLAEQQKTYEVEDQKRADWLAGAQTAWGNYKDTALDVNTQIQNATSMALNGFSSQLTNVLFEGEANFKDFTKSILKMLTDILIKMSLVKGIEAMGFGFGAPVANANGGVYNSASLSAYSGQIVHKPTMFAFAKGAGLMGEAGPEGIFPLRRGADGKLGVIAKMPNQGGGVTQHYHITIQNDGSNGQIGPEALKKVYEISKRGAQDYIMSQRRDGGAM